MSDIFFQFMLSEDEPTQSEPIYLSSNEDTETQNPMSD